jgi:hypothetical protein
VGCDRWQEKNRELKMQQEIAGRVRIHATIKIANEVVKS